MLAAAVEAHRASRFDDRDLLITSARMGAGSKAEDLLAVHTTMALCGKLDTVGLLALVVPSDNTAEQLGAVASTWLSEGNPDAESLAVELTEFGTRFRVLAIRAQQAFSTVDDSLLKDSSHEALIRSTRKLPIETRASFLPLALRCQSAQGREREIVDEELKLLSAEQILTAAEVWDGDIPAELFAEAAALAAVEAGNADAIRRWTNSCEGPAKLRVLATIRPTAQHWSAALEATMADPQEHGALPQTLASALVAGVSSDIVMKSFNTIEGLSGEDAVLVAKAAAIAKNKDLFGLIFSANGDNQELKLLKGSLTSDSAIQEALALWREVSQDRRASTEALLEASEKMVAAKARPVGTLVAILNRKISAVERVRAADLLCDLILDGAPAGQKASSALVAAAASHMPNDLETAMRWLTASVRVGSLEALSLLLALRGDSAASGKASLSLAELKAWDGDFSEALRLASDAYRWAKDNEDEVLRKALEAFAKKLSKMPR